VRSDDGRRNFRQRQREWPWKRFPFLADRSRVAVTGSVAAEPRRSAIRPVVPAPTTPADEGRPTDLGPPIDGLRVSAYTVPTDAPESDGTIAWDRTTIVIVEPEAGGIRGLGYSYADPTAARLIADNFSSIVLGRNAFDIAAIWSSLVGAVRNIGRPGIAATAISAVDNAMWDLKARLLGVSLVDLLGSAREAIPAYGSGGFCSYGDGRAVIDRTKPAAPQGRRTPEGARS